MPNDGRRRKATLTPGGADVAFIDVAASAKAGQAKAVLTPYVDLPRAAPAAPAAAAPTGYVPKARTDPAVFYGDNEKPADILFIMVSGKPGSGFEHLASLLVDEFDALRIAVESVADESFHEYVTDCGLCLRNKITPPCRSCPHSLESRSLYQTCRVAAEGVAGSTCFRSHNA